MKMLNFSLAVGMMLPLLACSNNVTMGGGAGSDAGTAADQEITAQALPAFTGQFVSPSSRLRVYADGRFALETSGEEVRWYTSAQPGTSADQHYATCKILRKGKLQVIQRGSAKLLRLNVAERQVLKADADSRSPKDDPLAVCRKSIDVMGQASPPSPLDLSVPVQGAGQFLAASIYTKQPYYIQMGYGRQDDLYASSVLSGELALLFTPPGKTTDVTDLLAATLTASFKAQDDTRAGRISLDLNPDFRTLHYVDTDCRIDATLGFTVVSDGQRVTIHAASPAASVTDSMTDSTAEGRLPGACGARRRALTTPGAASGPSELFDVTNLWDIRGLGAFENANFGKAYPAI